jgi:4-hydroxythreonine-4-phosphate dehydrogenase
MVVDVGDLDADAVEPGVVGNACGRAAADYIEAAVQAALDRNVAAIATAPINKEALRLAGVPYPGHTEMLAALTGAGSVCMMMASDDIVVSLATTHIALADVPFHLTTERIGQTVALTGTALRRVLGREPRMVVCGLNPHAGEHGLFGDEEARIIRPAVKAAHRAGWKVEGPLAPDTAFLPDRRRNTDAYVVMYHDQGLIPFKMLAFETGVNVTLGLPIVRTSVDHGTAFDIAWKGSASARSMVESIRWAVRLAG